ncbi:class I adenylate-forming enzyme family protein [Paenibacillus sp. GYB006]|uniref:class I adenylate-forming enzyme family protein n=1 Tax=Paenibacillus sp. GYB006 TaxID=2994394 RepID=UPI003FA73CA8
MNLNIVKAILECGKHQPDKIALVHNENSLSYSELVTRIKKVAHGFKQKGFHHDKIAILSTNRIEFVEVFLGIIYAGCVPIPLDPKWSQSEVNTILQQCDPRMIFTEEAYTRKLRMSDNEIPLLTFSHEETCSYAGWIDSLNPAAEVDETNELLFIAFTSGTTGVPKGYMRTHLSWMKSFEATSEAFEFHNMEHIMAPGPFVHSLSLFALMQSLVSGATFHIVEHFHAKKVLELCENIPGMILFVVPTMIESMMREAIPGRAYMQALISSGGKWSEGSKKRSMEVFGGAKMYEFYGSSEASYISYIDVYAENKPNSVGKPFRGVEISIRDEHFKELPVGEIGQLYIRSEMMFSGYYGLPDETANVFRDGWLMLGDYVSIDENGYLHLAGRAKNMIVSGGLNVFAEEVESVMQLIPAIEEVMVFGQPDDYWGEQVTALIQWSGEEHLSLKEIKEHCRRYLASYKAPKQLITVDQFIYTSSGKIARHEMKEYMRRVML